MRPLAHRLLARTRTSLSLALTAALIAVGGVAVAAGAAVPAQAATVETSATTATTATFNPGNIIDDATFYSSRTMTEAEIQRFLESKVTKCQSGYTCLRNFVQTTTNKSADAMCKGYAGAKNEPASRIIYKAATSCGINPRVLLVMLEKEQSLVTHTWPSQWRFDSALGQDCPDTPAGCSAAYKGFFSQMYGGAWQMKRYSNPAGTSNYFNWYPIGQVSNVRYHPNASCGSSPVRIQNQATASLYYYTPYQPNRAALAAGWGEGDSCSAYGNRNFFNLFTTWFGTTYGPTAFTKTATPAIAGAVKIGSQITATLAAFTPAADKVTYQWQRNAKALAGATSASYEITRADAGTKLTVTATASKAGLKTVSTTSPAISVPTTSVERISGASREETAIQVSKKAYPSGASTVMLATGSSYADALSASAVAAKLGASLLLTPTNALPSAVAAEIKRLGPSQVFIVGGGGAVSSTVAQSVASAVPRAAITRLNGTDRYDTSRKVAARIGTAETVYIATGRDFPDALTAASIAGSQNRPVLLVDGLGRGADSATVSLLKNKLRAKKIIFVGGEGVITPTVAQSFKSAGFSVSRIAGASRYDTNIKANSSRYPNSALETMLATGTDFPDALAGSVLAARKNVPMLLTPGTCVSTGAMSFMNSRGTNAVTLIGGLGALSGSVAQLQSC